MNYIKVFEEFTNKFKFKIGQKYLYDELPKKVQKDIDVQFEDNYDEGVEDFEWEFKLLKPKEIDEYVHNQFVDVSDALSHPDMIKLIDNIKKNGIDWPAVGIEGNHRALACWYLKIPLPYLEPIPINDI